MAAEKTTVMLLVLNADLQCPCCYKKIKKILCKFPQVRSQVYDEKANTVTITVECCSPHKIRDKLCCKGGKLIKSIDIKEPKQPEKPKEPETPKEAPKAKEPEKPKEPETPKEPPKAKEPEKPKEVPKPKEAPIVMPEPVKMVSPPQVIPHPQGYPEAVPTGYYCVPYYGGYPGGHCNQGHGDGYGWLVPQPQPTYHYHYGNRPYYASRCDYFSEENPQGCLIM